MKHIFTDFIILNNANNKGFYILVKKDDTYLIKGEFKYFNNIIAKNEYLYFDTVNNMDLEFNRINLIHNSPTEYDYFKEIFKFKVAFNIPKITALNNINKFVLLYEDNQICILDYNSFNDANQSNSLDTYKNNKENNIKEIKIKNVGPLIPLIMKNSYLLKMITIIAQVQMSLAIILSLILKKNIILLILN